MRIVLNLFIKKDLRLLHRKSLKSLSFSTILSLLLHKFLPSHKYINEIVNKGSS